MGQLIALFAIIAPLTTWAASGESITYAMDGQDYEGYYASPGDDAPLVLIIHDWDGLTDYEIQRADMLAEMGYAAFVADLFGAGVRPTATADKQRLTRALYGDRAKMRALMNQALATAEAQGANVDNAVAMGYCFGGAAVLELARSGADLKGFAPFHGGLSTPEGQDYSRAQGRYLVLHGTADRVVPMEDFADLAVALEQAGLDHEMITYGGAPHAFTVFGSDRYREEADQQSWAAFSRFLDTTLRP
ncbi:MAG: dienelactone hydrolase family protein [Candidatus Competibacterales bacterium]